MTVRLVYANGNSDVIHLYVLVCVGEGSVPGRSFWIEIDRNTLAKQRSVRKLASDIVERIDDRR